jgi:hypothetical protein
MINSEIIKTAVMSYYRFKRQMICADEVYCGRGLSDVLVESEKGYYDIEIKVSKSDLWRGEARKPKHSLYLNEVYKEKGLVPNYFIICVPEGLLEEAKKWVEETNKNYGILVFMDSKWETDSYQKQMYPRFEELIWSVKTPKNLREGRAERLHEILVKRLNSAYLNKRQQEIKRLPKEG